MAFFCLFFSFLSVLSLSLHTHFYSWRQFISIINNQQDLYISLCHLNSVLIKVLLYSFKNSLLKQSEQPAACAGFAGEYVRGLTSSPTFAPSATPIRNSNSKSSNTESSRSSNKTNRRLSAE
ncbi:uncharacterized protein V2V93DRAFT_59446 [Kockiozyma suomiensis]|uniref:uncharacterized protein n=1 Tax=Kockiozyma suomiensis TaxID=1337062 RepID=UPI0033435B67